ncbi:MAG TPA: UDP-N-acetylmuramoyl-L-alanyl-D-glutamate--2,6-diaminopimelate ligase [Tepidisphaeraceae bacterium]
MRLHSLLRRALPTIDLTTVADAEISGVQDDSRLVQPGDLFVARPGTSTDGNRFVQDAVARGAAAVIAATPVAGVDVPQVSVADPAAVLSTVANTFFENPAAAMKVLGITGTNGKTTTAYLIRHVLNTLGQRCGMIGTVEIDDGRHTTEADMTTPSAVPAAQLLAAMRDNGCAACAIETSSHALDQGRVAGVTFAGAGFTNLTGDHLDYHGSMEAYADAKARLFETLPADAVAALNADSPTFERMARSCRARLRTFGIDAAADYRAANISVTAVGTTFSLTSPHGRADVRLRLIGRHNIENALCAIVLCQDVFGLGLDSVLRAISTATGAPGRLQLVPGDAPFSVLVDYAHTDDALRNVLSALRPLTAGRLRVVFGCGGDRDRTKRPRMARVAEELADDVYVTSDNPRRENPADILDEIRHGLTAAGRERATFDVDRRAAIERAVGDSGADDVVLIAGKGHENYQIVGVTKHPFDDVEEATRAMAAVAS